LRQEALRHEEEARRILHEKPSRAVLHEKPGKPSSSSEKVKIDKAFILGEN